MITKQAFSFIPSLETEYQVQPEDIAAAAATGIGAGGIAGGLYGYSGYTKSKNDFNQYAKGIQGDFKRTTKGTLDDLYAKSIDAIKAREAELEAINKKKQKFLTRGITDTIDDNYAQRIADNQGKADVKILEQIKKDKKRELEDTLDNMLNHTKDELRAIKSSEKDRINSEYRQKMFDYKRGVALDLHKKTMDKFNTMKNAWKQIPKKAIAGGVAGGVLASAVPIGIYLANKNKKLTGEEF